MVSVPPTQGAAAAKTTSCWLPALPKRNVELASSDRMPSDTE